MIAPSSPGLLRYRRSARVDETRVGDRVVLYHRDLRNGIVLNPTGSLVWDSLVSPKSSDELVDQLSARFPKADTNRIAQDVAGYVESLLAHSLIDGEP